RRSCLHSKHLSETEHRGLALGELETSASTALTVLLALLHARIPREETSLLETLAQFDVVDLKRAGDAVTNGAGLAGRSAAVDRDDHVELVDRLSERERLLDDHLQHIVAEVVVEFAAVDGDLAAAWTHVHASRRCLAATRSVVFNQSQESSPPLFRYSAISSFSGLCASCG